MDIDLRKFVGSALASCGLLLVALTQCAEAQKIGCKPATPCPCAADGTCHPQGPWGHTPTRWRPWPGDEVGLKKPTREEEEKQEQLTLDDIEFPPPEKEGQRGPNMPESRRKRSADSNEDAPITEPGEDPNQVPVGVQPEAQLPVEQPLPNEIPQGGLEIPGDVDFQQPVEDAPLPEAKPADDFDPFGSTGPNLQLPKTVKKPAAPIRRVPSTGPPALPASLKKFSRAMTPFQRRTMATMQSCNSAPGTVAQTR